MKHKVMAIFLGALGCWAGMASAVPVARVSLAVGEATLFKPNGVSSVLARGVELSEQDRVVTGKSGMVMLVFSDQGRVAIRPESELVIRKYEDDPSGQATQLQLELMRGTVRQISGQAAQRQPDRYRLNTPIAAIGVRGTDFLAKATQGSVQTYVHEGAITVQPMQMGQSVGAQMLSVAGQSQYLLARAEGAVELRHVVAEETERTFGFRLGKPTVVAAQQGGASGAPARSQAAADTPLLAQATTASRGGWVSTSEPHTVESIRPAADGGTPSATAPAQPPAQPPVQSPVQPPVVDAGPPPLPEMVALPRQLVWGRFSDAAQLPLSLPEAYAQASKGRQVTVGELGSYALWREGASTLAPLRGTVDFAMAAGEGNYSAGGQTTALSLSQPLLQVDFDRMQFSTRLSMVAANVPAAQLNVSGKINTEGVFLGKTADQRVAGALNALGTEAGYLFQLNAPTGVYNGLTLWTKK
jgi:hypothetical protein